MVSKRLFVAARVSNALICPLMSIIDSLRLLRLDGIRWTEPNNLHLTLKFLGNTDSTLIPNLLDALWNPNLQSLDLHLCLSKAIGVFPNQRRPRIIWAGLKGDLEKLASLNATINANVNMFGFKNESRSFIPHLSLIHI